VFFSVWTSLAGDGCCFPVFAVIEVTAIDIGKNCLNVQVFFAGWVRKTA
jgi:hypothetical protein